MAKSDFIIEVNHVSKQFEDGKYALNDVSLQVKKGEFVVITGPNGSGKSTLAKLIMGIEQPKEMNCDSLLYSYATV